MRIFVYVEGPSDKLSMEALLRPLIETASQKGCKIIFHNLGNKHKVFTKGPLKAVDRLKNHNRDYVVLLPDLYPRNTFKQHATPAELKKVLVDEFEHILKRKGINDSRINNRFFVHCFKYDLEALILACPEILKTRIGKSTILSN